MPKTNFLRQAFVCLVSLFTFSCALAQQNANARFVSFTPPEIWLKPAVASPVYVDASNPLEKHTVGNYFTLDMQSEKVQAAIDQLKRFNGGTLFIVARADSSNGTGTKPWLRCAGIEVYANAFELKGKDAPVAFKKIAQEANLYTLRYQQHIRFNRKGTSFSLDSNAILAELLFFPRILEADEARRIESYLALKYSINITDDGEGRAESYRDLYARAPWDASFDASYNEEVLALGRCDTLGFFQTQTLSKDSRRIKISLHRDSATGKMPATQIQNASLLVFAKTEGDGHVLALNASCTGKGSALWKLKALQWDTPAEQVYFEIDTLLDEAVYNTAYLTNGADRFPVQVFPGKGRTVFVLPLAQALLNSPGAAGLYFGWGNPEDKQCALPVRWQVTPCAETVEGTGSMEVSVDPQWLPATLSLSSVSGHPEVFAARLEQEKHFFTHIPPGQYLLAVDPAMEKKAYSSPVYVKSCMQWAGETGHTVPGEARQTGAAGSTGAEEISALSGIVQDADAGSGPAGIEVFPNPAQKNDPVSFRFSGLNETAFTIYVYDAIGNQVDQKRFVPEDGANIFRYGFTVDGTYLLRFTSSSYSETLKVKIQSNLY